MFKYYNKNAINNKKLKSEYSGKKIFSNTRNENILQYVKKSTFNSLTADKNEYDKSCNMRCLF
jgi:uncharacterized membrane protein YfhO